MLASISLLLAAGSLTACFEPLNPVDTTASERAPTDGGTTGPGVPLTGDGTASSTGPATTDPDSGSSTADDSASSSSTGPDEPACTEPDGTIDAACRAGTPYCQGGRCISCDNLPADFCVELDPTTPLCNPGSGTCMGCNAHGQCQSGACRMQTGECFPGDQRLWVDALALGCEMGTGSQAMPFCTISAALDMVAMQPAGSAWTILVTGQIDAYLGPVMPSRGHIIAILGQMAPAVPVRIDSPATTTVDLLSDGIEVYMANLTLEHTGSGTQTIRCAFGNQVWLNDVTILNGPSLTLANCDVVLQDSIVIGGNIINGPNGGSVAFIRSFIEQGPTDQMLALSDVALDHTEVRRQPGSGGIHLNDAQALLELDNALLYGPLGETAMLLSTGQLQASFSTVAGQVACVGPGPSTVRDSIVTGLDCDSLAVEHSLVDSGAAQGMGNVVLPPGLLPALFVDPSGAGGDFHVLPGSLADGVAVWDDGDAMLDIDGDARVSVPGDPDYAGADVP